MLAHLLFEDGQRKEQTLKQHCEQTALYAVEAVSTTNLNNVTYLAGMLHDLGKATKKFNLYLEKSVSGENVVRGSVNHTFAGVIYILEKYHNIVNGEKRWECLTSEIVAYAIGAHHGLFDCVDMDGKNGFEHRLTKGKEEIFYNEAVKYFFEEVVLKEKLDEVFQKAIKEIQDFYCEVQKKVCSNEEGFFQIGLMCRLILSAVIYGDRRDTCEFMNSTIYLKEREINWKLQRAYLEDKISKFDLSTELNQIRRDISEQCARFAQNSTGIYRLNVPTGAGKTLCTLRYALTHAEKHKKKRIIFIIPLLSILDQNSKVIRENVTDESLVLEHHSNVINEKKHEEGLDDYEIMTENWNAPIVISTMVQFLNILFSHQTSAIGRMRALCDSVIVIDEIQSLPKKVTLMFNGAMNFLSRYCNTTIVLSSATQPCFEEVQWPIQFSEKTDMVKLNKQQLRVFERAEIIDKTTPYGMDLEECSYFCSSLLDIHDSLLVICNTKNEARKIYEKVQDILDEEVVMFHLSTSMCQAHRLEVLTELQTELEKLQQRLHDKVPGKKIVCVATQLVEAGVDFSFESVVRLMAGIDNLAQATGRCNRSCEYMQKGKVYFVNIKNEQLSKLPELKVAKSSTRKVLEGLKQNNSHDYIGEVATKKYFGYLFEETKKELKYPIKENGNEVFMAMLLANRNPYASSREKYILQYPFKTAGHRFQVFEDNSIDIIVPYKAGEKIIEELKSMSDYKIDYVKLKSALDKAKVYTISIYQWQKEKLEQYGLLDSCLEGRVLMLNVQAYHSQ